jgi:hypothetical protein
MSRAVTTAETRRAIFAGPNTAVVCFIFEQSLNYGAIRGRTDPDG